jgi:hypothetical protein
MSVPDLPALVEAASVVAVGRVTSVRQVGTTEVVVGETRLPAKLMTGEMIVNRELKGPGGLTRVVFGYVLPLSPAGGVGYREIPIGPYRLAFFRLADHEYEFVNPRYPSFPAIPDVASSGSRLIDRVTQQLAAVIGSTACTTDEKIQAMFSLQRVRSPLLTSVLKQAAAPTSEEIVRLTAVAALLERNEVDALAIAEPVLLQPSAKLPPYLSQNLASAIARGIRDEKAVPSLAHLLHAPAAETRRAAASAMRDIGSRASLRPLSTALDDSDVEVRYYAVIGLAEITRQGDWRPLLPEFQSNEQKYLDHWREWRSREVLDEKKAD